MTAIFPLYWDKSAHHEIRDFYARMALMDEHRFARYFCRYIGILLGNIPYIIKIFGQNEKARVASFAPARSFLSRLCVNQGNKKDARTRFTLRAQFFLSILP